MRPCKVSVLQLWGVCLVFAATVALTAVGVQRAAPPRVLQSACTIAVGTECDTVRCILACWQRGMDVTLFLKLVCSKSAALLEVSHCEL